MSHIFHQPNHRHAESFREERYSFPNHSRPTHHNRADLRVEEDYYYASKVEAPARYQAEDCCAETVYGRPGHGKYYQETDGCAEKVYGRPGNGKYYGDKVVDYGFTETVKEEDVVMDDCGERKHHGRFNRPGSF